MCLQVAGLCEGAVAGLTLIWAFPVMGSLVSLPVTGRLGGMVAVATRTWAIPVMGSLVCLQITGIRECLPTNFAALYWPLTLMYLRRITTDPCMTSLVSRQQNGTPE